MEDITVTTNASGLKTYEVKTRCGKDLVYTLNVYTGTLAMSKNLMCAMHYMLGCRECTWLKSVENDAV